jgi:hypothetical protein
LPDEKPHLQLQFIMTQLKLSFREDPESIEEHLQELVGRPVSLTLTDNSTRLLSFKTGEGRIALRLHRMFLAAPAQILAEIAAFIRDPQRGTSAIRRYIRVNRLPACRITEGKKPAGEEARGRIFDLKKVFDALNEEYFQGTVAASIRWGRRSRRRRVKKRILGTFCRETGSIRINPLLDKKTVPQYFVRFIVYHEMLHCALPGHEKNGRRYSHNAEFRRREREFREYTMAKDWEERNLC